METIALPTKFKFQFSKLKKCQSIRDEDLAKHSAAEGKISESEWTSHVEHVT